jgi:hypothetical protein
VSAQEGSRVELYRCVIAGAPAKVDDEEVTTGGCGVRAHGGSRVKAVECLFAFNHWNAAAHDGGAELELEGCQIFGAQFGVFAGAAGVVRMRGGSVRRNLYGLKLFGEGALLEATDVAIVDQTKNGVFVEAGSATLQGCKLVDNGSHGLGAAEGTDVVVLRCTVSENWESGLYLDGSCRIEECEICDNGEHAVVLESESRGSVRNNRCHENGGYGIVRHPASQVEIADNRTQANERDGLYTFGTLADRVAAAFPKGAVLPEGVKQLARFQEETGRLVGETLYIAPGPLAGWPGLESEFAVFGTGPDGSTIAYWLRDGLSIERAPIVYLDSEGVENFVLARTFEEFLSILATGRDDLRWGDDVEPEIDDEDELETLVEWMKETFEVEPAESIDAIRAAADEAHPGLAARLEAARPS